MKSQMMYRGETKKSKPSKSEKIATHFARAKKRLDARTKKKAAE